MRYLSGASPNAVPAKVAMRSVRRIVTRARAILLHSLSDTDGASHKASWPESERDTMWRLHRTPSRGLSINARSHKGSYWQGAFLNQRKTTDTMTARTMWTDAWLGCQLVRLPVDTDTEDKNGGSLYHALGYSAAYIFPGFGQPKQRTIAYPRTLMFLESEQGASLRGLLTKSLDDLGRFSLYVLDFVCREFEAWTHAQGPVERQSYRHFAGTLTAQILTQMEQRIARDWPALFSTKPHGAVFRHLKAGWNGKPQAASFFFQERVVDGRTTTPVKELFERVLPAYMQRCSEDIAHLEERDNFSWFALKALQSALEACIAQLQSLAPGAASPLPGHPHAQVEVILEQAFHNPTLGTIPVGYEIPATIKEGFDRMVASLLPLRDELERILANGGNFHYLELDDQRKLTGEECDAHLQDLAKRPQADRAQGAPLARLLLDALDFVDPAAAGISSLGDWLEAIAALYIADKDAINPAISRALQRYALIFGQASTYCATINTSCAVQNHFVARIWLMAAGYKAVWLSQENGDRTSLDAQKKVLRLYLNAIVSMPAGRSHGTPKRNFVEAGLFEWHPLAPAFVACNEILSNFRDLEHFGWKIAEPPAIYPRNDEAIPNICHKLLTEYYIQNEFSRSSSYSYKFNPKFDLLGLPQVSSRPLAGHGEFQ